MQNSRFEAFEETADKDITPGELESFRENFSDSIILSDQFIVILTVTGIRESSHIEGYFSDRNELEAFMDFVNSYGIQCFADYNLEEEDTMTGSISQLVQQNDGTEFSSVLDDASIVASLYLTSDSSWSINDIEEIVELRENGSMIEYHRLFGSFLDYPDKDIESYVFSQLPVWKKSLLSLIGRDVPEAILIDKAARKYGHNLSNADKRVVNAFTFHMIRDSEQCFSRAWKKSQERRDKLDAYLDVDDIVKELYD